MQTLTPTSTDPFDPARPDPRDAAHADSLDPVPAHATIGVDRPLRCVSSGYLADGCSCEATVPWSVVSEAWARELERAQACEDRFFRFMWRGGTWLGYGLRDGRVRGVYCPTHSARRAERSFVQSPGAARLRACG